MMLAGSCQPGFRSTLGPMPEEEQAGVVTSLGAGSGPMNPDRRRSSPVSLPRLTSDTTSARAAWAMTQPTAMMASMASVTNTANPPASPAPAARARGDAGAGNRGRRWDARAPRLDRTANLAALGATLCRTRASSAPPRYACHAFEAGRGAQNLVRAHLRLRLGKIELVRPHWRGDAQRQAAAPLL